MTTSGILSAKIRGMDEFKSYIDDIARNSRGVATETITDYLIGNESRGFKHYPPPMGQKYKRTGILRGGWMRRGERTTSRAENTIYYSPFVQGTGTQAHWAQGYGWRNVAQIIATNIAGACRAAEAAIVKRK